MILVEERRWDRVVGEVRAGRNVVAFDVAATTPRLLDLDQETWDIVKRMRLIPKEWGAHKEDCYGI